MLNHKALLMIFVLCSVCNAATTYFGHNVDGDGATGISNYISGNRPDLIPYTCPGTGNVPLVELGARLYSDETGALARLAICTYSGTTYTVVYQGASALNVSGSDPTWYTHTSFTLADGTPVESPILVGGTSYALVRSGENGKTIFIRKTACTSGDCEYNNTTDCATTDYPATFTMSGNSSSEGCIRAGVTISDSANAAFYRRRH